MTDNKTVTAPYAPPPPGPPAAPALSDEHLRQLAAAHAASRKVRRAVGMARADGWGVAIVAALTVLFGLTSASGLLLGAAFGAIAFVELRAANLLRRLEPRAARVLGFNQLALAGVLIAYALWRIYSEMNGTGEYAALAASDPQLGQMLQPVEDLTRSITYAIYAGLIAVAVFAQGGLSLYYFTRGKYVRAYVAQTPEWVLAVQKAGQLV